MSDSTVCGERSTTMRSATVTGLCEGRCIAGDVTISISFTRPVPVDQPLGCPLCGKPLRVIRTAEQWAAEVGREYPFATVREGEDVG